MRHSVKPIAVPRDGLKKRPSLPCQRVTVSGALLVTLFAAARMLTVVVAAGVFVLTLNEAFVAPAGTTLELVAGVATAVFVLSSEIVVPPDGAAHSSVAWPLTVPPPTTVEGVRVTAVR